MSDVFMSDGTLLQVSPTASPQAYVTIPGVMNVTPPSRARKTTDIYVHDQAAAITKTGAYEAMEVSFELAWDPSDARHAALFTEQDAKTERYYRIQLPSSPVTTMYFAATISQLEPVTADAEGTEPLKLNCVLKLNGNYTFV